LECSWDANGLGKFAWIAGVNYPNKKQKVDLQRRYLYVVDFPPLRLPCPLALMEAPQV
jgi:hypothetical protein